MLQINYIRENRHKVIERLKIKNFDGAEIIDKITELDDKRRKTQKVLDDNLSKANILAKQIGYLYKDGDIKQANETKQKTSELKVISKKLNKELDLYKQELKNFLLQVPNLPHSSVQGGNNVVEYKEGNIPELQNNALPHWDLATKYDIIDFKSGNKITGAGFPVYKDKGAKLQRSLINFFIDNAVKQGYTEIQPPALVNEDSGYGTGQLPDKDKQMYYINIDNLYLIPTAEVPITNLYRDIILKYDDLPIKNVAYSSCFRREAGSYGKDVRGLNRLHQFDKVEIVQIQKPDKSYQTLIGMQEYVASLLRKLELPFRIVKLCGKDTSFASALTYDAEVYSAAQKQWLEVSSISNFETFQANRMMLRFKDKNGGKKLPHTLNASALALPRIVAALLENNQSPKGIKIPKVLIKYTGFDFID
jgi:seryl-tRNA synthetase